MEKSTTYIKYFDLAGDVSRLHEDAYELRPDTPGLLTYKDGDKIYIAQLKSEQNTTQTSQDEVVDILSGFDIQGKLVTISAFNITKEVSKMLRAEGAEYVINVKGRRQNLRVDAAEYFEEIHSAETEEFKYDQVITRDTRPKDVPIEACHCYASTDVSWLHYRREWADIRSLCMISRETRSGGKKVRKVSYFISSLREPELFMAAARKYWGDREITWWMCIEDMPAGQTDTELQEAEVQNA